jgi:hypothetical protein
MTIGGQVFAAAGVRFDLSNPRPGALECADRVARFIAQLDVPHSLTDAGVPHNEIAQIAAPVLDEVERRRWLIGRSRAKTLSTCSKPPTRDSWTGFIESTIST